MARILVLSSDPSERESLVGALTEAQHTVEPAGDLPTALQVLSRAPVDLILADLGGSPLPPDRAPVAVLTAAAPATPVLATIAAPTGDLPDPRALRLAGLLRKPVSQAELLARVRAALAGQQRWLRQRQRTIASAEARLAATLARVVRSSLLLHSPLPAADLDRFLTTEAFTAALRDQLWLQVTLRGRDLATDRDWQQTFIRYYRLRLPTGAAYRHFFQLLEHGKSAPLPFPAALAALARATGRVEPASASKLVAMLDPSQPVMDERVLATFGLHPPPRGSQDAARWSALYAELGKQYAQLAQEPLGIEICERFTDRFPAAPLPDLKKLDLVVWQANVLGLAPMAPPPVAGAEDAVATAFGPRYWALLAARRWARPQPWPRRVARGRGVVPSRRRQLILRPTARYQAGVDSHSVPNRSSYAMARPPVRAPPGGQPVCDRARRRWPRPSPERMSAQHPPPYPDV